MSTTTIKESLRVGAKMPDGTIYAGVSPDTGRPMFSTPTDTTMRWPLRRLCCDFKAAADSAGKLAAHGHQDWRVPTKAELNVLFGNRAAIGGFDTTGSDPAGWYWSSSLYNGLISLAWAQRFSDGEQFINYRVNASALRCVRG